MELSISLFPTKYPWVATVRPAVNCSSAYVSEGGGGLTRYLEHQFWLAIVPS